MTMAGYTKLFQSIVTSTVWREADHVRLVWVTMLALSDKWGVVEASVPGLADMARVTIPQCQDALRVLSSPDAYSRTKVAEGRRVEPTDGGWQLINHGKYRDKMSADERRLYNATKQRESRQRRRESMTVNDESAESAHTEAKADTEAEASPDPKAEATHALASATRAGIDGRPKPLIDGRDIRRHGQHAWCDFDRGLCVPPSLHDEFQKRGRKTDADLRAWYPSIIAKLGDQPVGDDLFDFWRAAFGHWVGTVAVKPSARRLTKNEEMIAASQRVLSRIEGRKP